MLPHLFLGEAFLRINLFDLKTGVHWQVGNGECINIWSDSWLPGSSPRCATSPQRENAPQLVAELIDFERGTWRLDVLEQHFSPADIDSILSIPISQRFPQDRLVWHFHKKGLFTTKVLIAPILWHEV